MKPDPKPIVNLTRGTVVCEHATVADRPLRRMRGLLGRRLLPVGEGILLQPAPSIHTCFMRFPIDVIFLDRNLQVVKVTEALGPWRIASARHARAALELPAGEAAVRQIENGDRLGVVSVADGVGTTNTGGGAEGSRSPKLAHGTPDSLQVLLVGTDRRFRSVASALLTRRGCTVTVGEGIDSASRHAGRERPEVVVIDADSSPVAAAREAAHIHALEPPVGVVLVADDPDRGVPTMPVIAKWGSFDELYRAIRTARSDGDRRRLNGRS